MFGSILHRMILWELLKVFLMSLVGITGILLMGGIIAEASQEGLGPSQILEAIPLLIPSTLPFTIPATTLFACCVVYGRLSADNEILAIKSSGVNIVQVVGPALLLGLAASAATMGLYYDLIPSTHRMLRQMAYADAEELIYSMLRREKAFNVPQLPYAIWVKDVDGRKLFEVTIKGRDAEGKENFVAQAKEAELRVDMAHKKLVVWMRVGSATTLDGQGAPLGAVAFEAREVEIDLPPFLEQDMLHRARDMTWQEMQERRKDWAEKEAVYQKEIEERLKAGAPDPPGGDAPPDLAAAASGRPKTLAQLRFEQAYLRQQILWVDVEMLMRPAQCAGCFFFVLVGCPVGIWLSRSDYLSAFIVCFLPIVLVYYPLMLCGTGMAKEGHIAPFFPVWGPDLLMGVIGAALFWRLLRN